MNQRAVSPGTLYVVATPIGNLGDLTDRAVRTLRAATCVVAEDTRRSGQLLQHLGSDKPLISLHKFNERERIAALIARLVAGENLALITDGGTPAISDPGHRLVAAAHAAGLAVRSVPGAAAVAAALSVAGFPADRFFFAGFLPAKSGERRRQLAVLSTLPDTLVFYEAPHRVLAMLSDLQAILGDRPATLCRELTKLHEEVLPGSISTIAASLAARDAVRGEIVLVVAGSEAGAASVASADEELLHRVIAALQLNEGDLKRAVQRVARELGVARKEVMKRLRPER